MKKQKPARLFRALFVSSALASMARVGLAQEGSAFPGQAGGNGGSDGVASLGQSAQEGVAPVPAYDLPQYDPRAIPQLSNDAPNWYTPPGGRRGLWQDEVGPRFRLETRIGDLLGTYDDGDAGLNVMLPFRAADSNLIFFVDGRGTASYNGQGAATAGFGVRYFDTGANRVYGLSGWYDYDDTNRNPFHQAGVSIESFGKWFDFIANGYIPLSQDSYNNGTTFANARPGGLGILIDQIDRVESLYAGFNVEVGAPLPLLGRYGFQGYVGGYYFQNDGDDDVGGVSLRINAQVTDDLTLGINVTNDHLFDTQVFGTVSLTLPDGRAQKFFRPKSPEERLLARTERRNRAFVHRQSKTTTIDGTGMVTGPGGSPLSRIVYVSPFSPTNGIGSASDPLNTLLGFVNPGAGTLYILNSGNVTGPATLSDNSAAFSQAYLNLNPLIINTPAGQVPLASINPNATPPVWTSPNGGNIVTIAGSNTEIAGIVFDGTTANAGIPNSTAIAGSNFSGFHIHDNTFRNYTDGIVFNNVTGTFAAGNPGLLHTNTFLGQSGTSFRGFSLTNTGPGTLDLEVGSTELALLSSNGSAAGNVAMGNTGEDANGNGLLDANEDRNANGVLDLGVAFEITARNRAVINANIRGNITAQEDANRDGKLASEDLNANGILDIGEDANGNNRLDFGEDLNRNGRLDTGNSRGFVITAGASQAQINLRMLDNLIQNNTREGVVLAANSSTINAATIGEDVNGDGILTGFEDLNGDGVLQVTEDLNGNGTLDAGEDRNNNGALDVVDEDANNNGVLDFGEDVNEDTNANGKLDVGEDRNGDGYLNQGNRDGRLNGGNLLAGNQILRNGGDGLHFDVTNSGSIAVRMLNNQVGQTADRSTGNQGTGITVSGDSGDVRLTMGYLYDEDVNFNGLLDIGEDLNNNGKLDLPDPALGNQVVANFGGAVRFDLTGDAVGQFNAIGNTFEGIGGGSLGFIVSGPTPSTAGAAPFTMSNDSALGINISRVVWNLAGAGLQFNTDAANSGQQFTVASNTAGTDTGVLTGLQTVNGTSNPFTVQNLATTLDMVFNDFDSKNGVLDTGEDLPAGAGNGILDAGEDLGEQFIFQIDLDQAGVVGSNITGNQLIGSIVDVTFSSGQQLRGIMQAVPGNATAAQFIPTLNNLGVADGISLNVASNATLLTSQIRNNSISNFGGNGLTATAANDGSIQNLLIRNNSIVGNGAGNGSAPFGNGVNFVTNAGPGGTANLTAALQFNTISNNINGGISATANGGTMNLSRIENNTFNANGGGIQLSALQSATLTGRISNNTITNSTKAVADNDTVSTNDALGDGLSITSNNSTIILSEIAFNSISSNAGEGISLATANGGTLTTSATEDINANGVLDPGEDANEDANTNGVLDPGEDVNGDGALNRGNANGLLDRGVQSNTIQNNAGIQFSGIANNATLDLGDIRNMAVTTNTAGTGNFALVGSNGVIRANFYGNIITGDNANNPAGGPGLLVSATGGSYDINVGGPNITDGNIFQGNRGAGIALVLSDTGTGAFLIENNEITRISDDANINTPFSGDGINVSLVGSTNLDDATATLTRSTIRGNVIGDFTNANLGTAGSGIAVLATERTVVQDLLIENNKIGRAGNDNTTRTTSNVGGFTFVDGDGDAGIRIDREDDAIFDSVNPLPGDTAAVNIRGNEVRNNVGGVANGTSPVNGLLIDAKNGIQDDIDFDVRNNIFSNNSGNGIQLQTRADASLAVNLTKNTIENNTLNGILLTGVENIATDLETQGGVWIQNTIRGNLANGIQISGVSGSVIPLVIGQLGNDPVTGESLGNLIENNGQVGILITAGGSSQINNNIITNNGTHGIQIDLDQILSRADLLRENSILSNGRSGIQYRHEGGQIDDVSYLLAFGNNIDSNRFRGVDVLSQGIVTTNIRFGDGTLAGMNHITSNFEEGFYVVNTASRTQTANVDSSTALLSNGSVIFSQADMVLDLNRNEISSNNNQGDFIGGGLVIRAGTTNGGFSAFLPADDTGTALHGVAVGANNSLFGNGRINARVINNTFEGNLGDDVYIESFTSTVDPNTTGGAWNATTFNPTGYQSDPLARLNLVFTGNVGNSVNVTVGQFDRSNLPGQSADAGAFYNNGEGVFKSRLNNATPPGPFPQANGATRRRNAQRLPLRENLPPAPGTSPSDTYEYPGLGASTFRVESNFDVSGFQSGDGFFLDGQPYQFGLANGVPFTFPNLFGEEPFGWGTATPGSFEFDPAFQGIFP